MEENNTFLLTLDTEELPARLIGEVARSFGDAFILALFNSGFIQKPLKRIPYENLQKDEGYALWSSPRRISLYIPFVLRAIPPKKEKKTGLPWERAFDDNQQPTKALLGFLKSHGSELSSVQKDEEGDKARASIWVQSESIPLEDSLSELILGAAQKASSLSSMRWGEGLFRFTRPILSILALHGESFLTPKPLSGSIPYVKKIRVEQGNFHGLKSHQISILRPMDYLQTLARFDPPVFLFDEGRDVAPFSPLDIRTKLQEALAPYTLRKDDHLILENARMLERVYALSAPIDEAFVSLPTLVIQVVLTAHQRCFITKESPVSFVALIPENPTGLMKEGWSQVIKARLSDALYFFKKDLKTGLESMQKGLEKRNYAPLLGSFQQKTKRMEALLSSLELDSLSYQKQYEALGAEMVPFSLFEKAKNVALSAVSHTKSDLNSELVGEMPELQGKITPFYAQGLLSDDATKAIAWHYDSFKELPKNTFSDPVLLAGGLLAFLDHMDKLVGYLGLKKEPQGNKDPYALRRSFRILERLGLLGFPFPLDLQKVVLELQKQYDSQGIKLSKGAESFLNLAFLNRRLSIQLSQNLLIPVKDAERIALLLSEPIKEKAGIENFQENLGKPLLLQLERSITFLKDDECITWISALRRFNLLKGKVCPIGLSKEPFAKENYQHQNMNDLEHQAGLLLQDEKASLASLCDISEKLMDSVRVFDEDKKTQEARLRLSFDLLARLLGATKEQAGSYQGMVYPEGFSSSLGEKITLNPEELKHILPLLGM